MVRTRCCARSGRWSEQAAATVLDFVPAEPVDPATYGELVRDGAVLPWSGGPTR
ncbi:MAG TPA: hypothetical protein VGD29_19875 [Actinoplanes sp.]